MGLLDADLDCAKLIKPMKSLQIYVKNLDGLGVTK